jgi:type IV secretion system protein VirB5
MKKIRKLVAGAVCVVAMAAVPVAGVHAGIPVFDGAAVLNLVTQYQQLMQQYTTLKNQLSTATNQLDSMTGSRGMAGLLSNPAVKSQLPADWAQVMNSVKSTGTYTAERNKLPQSTDPRINAIYDNVATNNATMVDFFRRANDRMAQVAQLQASIDSASDPAAKADLQNRIASEQNSIAGTTQLLQILREKQAQDLSDARAAASRSRMCAEFKNSCT